MTRGAIAVRFLKGVFGVAGAHSGSAAGFRGKIISEKVECDRQPEEMTRGADVRKLRLAARVAAARAASMASPSASACGCPPLGLGLWVPAASTPPLACAQPPWQAARLVPAG